MEAGLVARESDLPFRAVPAAALRGRNPLALIRNGATLARGTRVARRLIAQERPAAILGTGGYVCVPVFVAARAMGVPTMVYLPDVVPGLAIRFLTRLATMVACNVEDSRRYFGLPATQSKMIVTGYPVRNELFAQDKQACRAAFGLGADLPVLFVYGGSRGARSINQAVAALLPSLLAQAQIIHVCGREGDEGFLRASATQLSEAMRARYRLYPYLFSGSQRSIEATPLLPSMIEAFGAADLAMCRSGASTLAELPTAALPAVLVPYPYVHQDENADYLVRHGAAIKVADGVMLGGGRPEDGPLFQSIRELLTNHEERKRMSERSHTLARPDAARQLAELLLDLAARRVLV